MRNRTIPDADDGSLAFGDEAAMTSPFAGVVHTQRVPRHTMEYAARLPARAPGVTFRQFVVRGMLFRLLREPEAVLPLGHSCWTGRFLTTHDIVGCSESHLTELEALIMRTVRDDSWNSILSFPPNRKA